MRKLLFLAVAISFGAFSYFYWQRTVPLAPALPSSSPVVRISLPELAIDVPVVPTKLEGVKWEYTTKGAAYLSSTPIPGSVGNSVFYGHNWPNIFGKLPNAKPGNKVVATYADGSSKLFLINTTAVVDPSHTEILNPTSDIRLTLFTCTGFLDKDRFVATAIPL